MGRYAFFNTGFEYKFVFSVQPSEDILKFGGTPKFVYEGDNEHKWTIVDRPRILDRIRDIEITLGLPSYDFEPYEKTLDGTYKLRHDLWDISVSDMELFATYVLGCILYHQLLYELELSCTYES
jgi:hypothetical protein